MSLCAVGLMSTAAFASSGTEVKESAKSRRVECRYVLNFYDSHGNYLSTESTYAKFPSGGCSNFFRAMRKHYSSMEYQLHNVG